MQSPGNSNVIEVMPGSVGERAILAPAGDAPVDQPRIARMQLLWPKAKSLGDTGSKPFDEYIGSVAEFQQRLETFRAF